MNNRKKNKNVAILFRICAVALLVAGVLSLTSCKKADVKDNKELVGYWCTDDAATTVVVSFSKLNSKEFYMTIMDNTLDIKAIGAKYTAEGGYINFEVTAEEAKALGSDTTTISMPYMMTANGNKLTLLYGDRTVRLQRFNYDLSEVPTGKAD